ncbi:Wzb Protein-tyrosine-phosphatase [Pyrenophora tritici-repentis]|nr:Wzb Protein-tyrosine-phosphatase [Pyrenophora tritici-repentis]
MADSTKSPKPVSVLFVCLGNICRSTMAEGVFQSLTSPSHPLITTIDSCGTGAYHVGSSPDSRTMSTLRAANITTYKHSARKFSPRTDFGDFDYILCMDDENLADVEALRREEVRRLGGSEEGVGKVMLFDLCRGHVCYDTKSQISYSNSCLLAQFASFMLC